ncbi:hypothetical protein BAE44_0007450 [Dichanthelium oligosanthes]|uniref:Uncharacterized protein n=1 Tax=Dichanthelium oligosanthes TaxID=888268 RepID=A0A1E5W2G0_9POAL|nr:hypothetical protein BAE44_0007450 [Dichanthelium oligosanthes]
MADPVAEYEVEVEEEEIEEEEEDVMKVDEWDWAIGKDEKKAWVQPMLAELKRLKRAGLTGVRVLWTFFERRVQPLKARAHPLYRYTGVGDPMRLSRDELTPLEVRARVRAAIKRSKHVADDVAELDRHQHGLALEPAARREGLDLPVRALSEQKKKLKADQARRHMLRQQGRLLDESEEDDDDDEGDEGEDDNDDNDDDDEEGSSGLGQDQLGDAPISAGEVPQSTETAPASEVGPLRLGAEEPPQPGLAAVIQVVTPLVPASRPAIPLLARTSAGPTVEADFWNQFLSHSSSPPHRATPIAVVGTGGSAATAAAEPAVAAEEGATAGRVDVAVTETVPRSTAGPQAEEVPEDEERFAAMLEAAMDVEVEADPGWSEVPLDEAAPEVSEVSAEAASAAGMPPAPLAEAEAQEGTEAAAEVPVGTVSPAARPGERPAAEDVEGEALVGLVAPASAKGKEPMPRSGEELTQRHHRTGETLLKVEFQREEEDRAEMEWLVEQVSTAFTALVERSRRSVERNTDKSVFLRDVASPYIRRAERMKDRRRDAEHRASEAEAKVESLRRELACTAEEVNSLRDAGAQAERIAGEIRQQCDAVERQRALALRERDDARGRATAAEDEVERLRWELGREQNEEELGRTRDDLAAREAELGELARAAVAVNSFTFGTAGASGSSTANRLAGVPDANLDLEAIGRGVPTGGEDRNADGGDGP